MQQYKIIGSVLVATMLAACAGNPPPQVSLQNPVVVTPPVTATATPMTNDPLAKLAAFTLADLQAADADAKAQMPPDVTASQCYDYLIAVIPTIKLPGFNPTVGAVLAFQRGRDLANGVTLANGQLKSLNLACAALVIDTQTTINRLGCSGRWNGGWCKCWASAAGAAAMSDEIFIAGHSLGAADAFLYAYSRTMRGLRVDGIYAFAFSKARECCNREQGCGVPDASVGAERLRRRDVGAVRRPCRRDGLGLRRRRAVHADSRARVLVRLPARPVLLPPPHRAVPGRSPQAGGERCGGWNQRGGG